MRGDLLVRLPSPILGRTSAAAPLPTSTRVESTWSSPPEIFTGPIWPALDQLQVPVVGVYGNHCDSRPLETTKLIRDQLSGVADKSHVGGRYSLRNGAPRVDHCPRMAGGLEADRPGCCRWDQAMDGDPAPTLRCEGDATGVPFLVGGRRGFDFELA
jgi:hypothetical protein